MEQARRREFAELLAVAEDDNALERGALLIAGRGRPQLDIEAPLAQLDRLASAARQWIDSSRSSAGALELGRFLHQQAGFAGNIVDYYDPANSYLDQVLDRRIGIPVTLAVLYIAIGRRLDMDLYGVGFPGHLLVGSRAGGSRQLLAPFTGELADDAACERLAQRLFGRSVAMRDQWFERLTVPAIWFRMLGNLRQIFMGRREFQAALDCCDWQLLIDPRAAQELLDRGLLMEQLGNTAGAHAALRHFLMLHAGHHAAPAVQVKVTELARAGRWLH